MVSSHGLGSAGGGGGPRGSESYSVKKAGACVAEAEAACVAEAEAARGIYRRAACVAQAEAALGINVIPPSSSAGSPA